MHAMSHTVIILGVAFLASGGIRFAMRGTIDPDVFVGAVFLVSGLVMRWLRR